MGNDTPKGLAGCDAKCRHIYQHLEEARAKIVGILSYFC